MRRKKILVVEDDDAIREAVVELLDSEGFETFAAADGKAALDYLARRDVRLPDLILLDLAMPVKDGMQFCAETDLDERIAAIPIVIMSADSQIGEKQQATRARAFIAKPIDIKRLLELVENTTLV